MFTSEFRPRRSIIPLIVELSFAEDAPGTAPVVAGQSGGGGTTPPVIQTPASAADPAQLHKQLVSEAFSSGLNEQRDRTISKFQKAGIDIMKDEDGKPSISLTLAALEERMKAAAKTFEKAKLPGVIGGPDPLLDERVRELQAQLELVTGQKTQAESKAAELDVRFQQQLEKIELTAAFSGSELVEGALDDGIDLFLKRFKITRTSEDEIRVKSRHNGMNVLNAEAKPASINEAVKKFLEETPYLRKSTVPAGGGAGGRKMAAGVQQVTREDLARGRVDPKKIMDGTAVVID